MRFGLLLALFLSVAANPVNSWAGKVYRVVVFGDSITQGYQLQPQDAFPARLQQKLRAMGYDAIEVINMSKVGAATAAATNDTQSVIQKLPDVVIVQLGYNDTRRGVLPTSVTSSLNMIVGELKRAGIYVVLAGINAPATLGEDYSYQILQSFYVVAKENNVPLYPNIVEGIHNSSSLTLADGIHPNSAGVDVLVNGLVPLVDAGLRWRYEVYQSELEQQKKAQQGSITAPPPP